MAIHLPHVRSLKTNIHKKEIVSPCNNYDIGSQCSIVCKVVGPQRDEPGWPSNNQIEFNTGKLDQTPKQRQTVVLWEVTHRLLPRNLLSPKASDASNRPSISMSPYISVD
jgi:hypothetical protein